MKILFIVHDLYQSDNQFPLGIGYLSSILRINGHEVEIYCMDVFHYTNEELIKKLDNEEYDIIGLDFLAARFKETIIELCKIINEHKKNAWLVLGGHGPSATPDYMLNKTNCDVICIGESEETILDVLKDRKHNIRKRIYQAKPIKNLDEIPYPAWDLFPINRYSTGIRFVGMEEKDKTLQIISSRGCINRCTFCYRMERGIRLRSIKNLVDEMAFLKNTYGITTFHFQDEMFLVSKKRLLEFRDALNNYNLDIKFLANARVDIFSEEIAQILKDMGCILINIGFESSSQEVLDYMKKNVKIEQNMRTLEISKKVGLANGLNFIWGYPPDTYDTLKNNAKLIKKYNLYHQLRTERPVTPYPGCELYYEAIEKGLLAGPEDFYNKFTNSDLFTVNMTKFSNSVCYEWLFEVNKDLIIDHYQHTDGDKEEMDDLIQQFRDLYDGKIKTFRGARHYARK